MVDVDSLTDAEQRLVDALNNGSLCDLSNGQEIQASDMVEWGDERIIRADVLKKLLIGDAARWGIDPGAVTAAVKLRGAVVSGDLGGFVRGQELFLQTSHCRFDGKVKLGGARFTTLTSFTNATFAHDVTFDETTFDGTANFEHAVFNGPVSFYKVTFTDVVTFRKVIFGGDATSLERSVGFLEANFTGNALFDDATFTTNASFIGATFNDIASFEGATFTAEASFGSATFTGIAHFQNALARDWNFYSSTFAKQDPGPWTGTKVTLDHAVLMVRSRLTITAQQVYAKSLQAREGAHLILHSEQVDLSDAEFLRRTIVASPVTARPVPTRQDATDDEKRRDPARAAAKALAWDLRKTLAHKLSNTSPKCILSKLDRSIAGELVLSNVVLDDCTFAGAHGLDKIRIGADCSFRRTLDPSSPDAFTRRRIGTRRRIIAEEIAWRTAHTDRKNRSDDIESSPSAADIASTYRDLRKGLEDVKNEPEAADFYYGEMEMRRLAGRGPGSSNAKQTSPSYIERLLLWGYWAVSGYGLRAWRAATLLIVLIVAAALLFSHLGLATQTSPERIVSVNLNDGSVKYVDAKPAAPGFLTALNFSAREGVSLLHADTASVKPHGAGTLLDFILRLAGPVLVAFIVLALRARTKR